MTFTSKILLFGFSLQAIVVSLQTDPCQLPSAPGGCLAFVPSFYYDKSANQCKRFIYGGCGGNANRFSKMEDCEKTCKVKDVCLQSTGPCINLTRYSFDSNTRVCYSSGCSSQFNTLDDCKRHCEITDPSPVDVNFCYYNGKAYKYNEKYTKRESCMKCICYYGLEICQQDKCA